MHADTKGDIPAHRLACRSHCSR
uniref:Uncharacterized protein n=1 Tax=Anguilla anguilla TaxID=7936 RepID=A0A0E9UIG2_ANGAN